MDQKKARITAEGMLFCIENPLLDISAHVKNELLEKYLLLPYFLLPTDHSRSRAATLTPFSLLSPFS